MSKRQHRDTPGRLPLPTPRPDPASDEKILAYARARAPRRQLRRPGRWAAGLATAGIVAVAVMITLPRQPPTAILKESARPAARAPAAAAGMKVDMLKMSSADAPRQLADEEVITAASPAPARDADKPVFAERENAAGKLAAQSATVVTPAAVVTPAEIGLQLEACRALLGSTAEARARAVDCYQRLRQHCTGCELPDTLEQALARYPAPE